jgi:predicted ester cyclase
MSRRVLPFRLLIALTLLVVTVVPTTWAQDNLLPAPTGPYPVGVAWRHWVDETRDETFGNPPQGNREVMVEILYPAETDSDAEGSPYIPNADQVLPTFASLLTVFGVPLTIGPADVADFQAHAIANAPLADDEERYPVLIFSHGGAADVTMYTAQLEELASQGYVVVGVNHAYGAAAVVLPDGRTVTGDYTAGLEVHPPIWTQDHIFVMDQLEVLNADDPEGVFTGRLDLERLGVFGASLGGATATLTCSLDARCKAGVNEDGPVYGDVIEEGLDQPFLYLLSDSRFFSDPAFYEAARGPFYTAAFAGFEHIDFGDFPLWPTASDQLQPLHWLGSVEPTRAVELTRAYLVAFFDKYLKGAEDTLFDTATQPYPEVTLESRPATQTTEVAVDPFSEAAVTHFVEQFDAIFDGPNVAIADEIFAPDFVGHLPLARELDRDGWKAYVESFYAAFSDLTQDVNQVIIGHDRVVLHVTYTGTHDGPLFGIPATGNTVTMTGIGIFRFNEEGLVVENWAELDVVGVLTQLEAFPPAQ